jgi:hypothetical protein
VAGIGSTGFALPICSTFAQCEPKAQIMDYNILTVSKLKELNFLHITPRDENILCLFRQIVNAHNQFEWCFRCNFKEGRNVLLRCENNGEVRVINAICASGPNRREK